MFNPIFEQYIIFLLLLFSMSLSVYVYYQLTCPSPPLGRWWCNCVYCNQPCSHIRFALYVESAEVFDLKYLWYSECRNNSNSPPAWKYNWCMFRYFCIYDILLLIEILMQKVVLFVAIFNASDILCHVVTSIICNPSGPLLLISSIIGIMCKACITKQLSKIWGEQICR